MTAKKQTSKNGPVKNNGKVNQDLAAAGPKSTAKPIEIIFNKWF